MGLYNTKQSDQEIEKYQSEIDQNGTLNLSQKSLIEISSLIFEFKELKKLVLDHNLLSELPQSVPDDQIWNPVEVSLSYNRFKNIPKSLNSMYFLQKLVLDFNDLEELNANLIPPTLSYLSIKNNKLRSISTFKHYYQISELYLDNNELVSLPVSIDEMKKLKVFSLSNNLLNSLPETMGNLRILKQLNVSNNQLKSLPRTLSIHHIEDLQIENNPIVPNIPDSNQQIFLSPQNEINGWNISFNFNSEYQIHAKRLWEDLKPNFQSIKLLQESEISIDLLLESDSDIGSVFQWIAVNRHPRITINLQPISTCSTTQYFRFYEGYDPVGNEVQGYPLPTNSPSRVIDNNHIHLHYNHETEDMALQFYLGFMTFLNSNGVSPHKRVWYSPNGPHLGWSWEVHLPILEHFSLALSFLVLNKPKSLSCLAHVRTHDNTMKNEWDDHAHRLAWIGPPDSEDVFQIKFFKDRLPHPYNRNTEILK